MLLLWALIWSFNSPSYASSFTAIGGYAASNGTEGPSETFKTAAHSNSILYGGFVEYQLFKRISLEAGLLVGQRGFKRLYSDETASQLTFNTIQLPLLMRVYFVPVLSFGIGGYFSHGYGKYTETSTTGDSSQSDYGFGTYAADDYGSVLSLAMKVELFFSTYLVLDLRYLHGFQNISHFQNVSTSLRDVQGLVGIRFGR